MACECNRLPLLPVLSTLRLTVLEPGNSLLHYPLPSTIPVSSSHFYHTMSQSFRGLSTLFLVQGLTSLYANKSINITTNIHWQTCPLKRNILRISSFANCGLY